MLIKKLLDELSKLWLPKDQYAIFGSWPMAVRFIRETNDIDLIVKRPLWDELVVKYKDNLRTDKPIITIWNIEIIHFLEHFQDKIEPWIDEADMISWFPFVKLENIKEYKQFRAREKDLVDIVLIDGYHRDEE